MSLLVGWGACFISLSCKDYQTTLPIPKAVQKLQVSYAQYKSLTGKELLVIWNDMFFDAEYKLNGDMKFDKYDCSSASWRFFRRLESNVVFENTEDSENRLKRITTPRKYLRDIEVGDVIIFNRVGDNGHMAVLVKVNKRTGLVRYVDVNVMNDGLGFNSIIWNDTRIKNIYPVTFDYWCGDVLVGVK
jgi:hypothetical protein